MKASIGRIVYLRALHDANLYSPAIITKVHDDADGRVNLTVFPDCGNPFFAMNVEHGDGGEQWIFPPRVSS